MAGLFDYQSPENMRAARLQPLLVSGAQMGQQPLLSQLVSQMSNAGANIRCYWCWHVRVAIAGRGGVNNKC
jgi:hypothetical protein